MGSTHRAASLKLRMAKRIAKRRRLVVQSRPRSIRAKRAMCPKWIAKRRRFLVQSRPWSIRANCYRQAANGMGRSHPAASIMLRMAKRRRLVVQSRPLSIRAKCKRQVAKGMHWSHPAASHQASVTLRTAKRNRSANRILKGRRLPMRITKTGCNPATTSILSSRRGSTTWRRAPCSRAPRSRRNWRFGLLHRRLCLRHLRAPARRRRRRRRLHARRRLSSGKGRRSRSRMRRARRHRRRCTAIGCRIRSCSANLRLHRRAPAHPRSTLAHSKGAWTRRASWAARRTARWSALRPFGFRKALRGARH
mmetsp:Transcript_91028/g.293887  ORF Transcript_91028/g.293887 Transcript_91028/m.293887 type:complete len:307 (-) Transcript_91028:1514-2434(-)